MTVRVRDYMVLEVEQFNDATSVGDAIDRLMRTRHHGLPVTDARRKLVGFVEREGALAELAP